MMFRISLGLGAASYRNRDAAFALAVFIGRFWSAPGRIEQAFPIDRRALANRPDLGLTEAKVRGAIRTLESAGFLDRVEPDRGSRYQRTDTGDLHRKPVCFRLGLAYRASFETANKRAQKRRERQGRGAAGHFPGKGPRPSMASQGRWGLKSPKSIERSETSGAYGRDKIPSTTDQPQPQARSRPGPMEKGCRRAGPAPVRPTRFVDATDRGSAAILSISST